ncbi:purine nucleoside permease [Shewanella avicenniae]|uniref:Purine nucleoside permease n=1 Tax=Shewanella avicenniae TaxID=2814294 RepID=A0ABX7QKV5_9GAMM|nr:purine nucleoside permease [Shewanella avicenniae]QSX32088.1 purine nucleoside permease [Shewanella avicenniae]
MKNSKNIALAVSVVLASTVMSLNLASAATEAPAITPKVLIVTMFGEEAAPWQQQANLSQRYPLAGLSAKYPELKCNTKGVCMVTTDMGYANAATTLTALAFNPQVDLRQSYIIIAGIGGVNPEYGTLGSAHWAQYAVDGGLVHRMDARQMPAGWPHGLFALGATQPGEAPKWRAGTEVFQLNATLVDKAYQLTKNVALFDSKEAAADRRIYPQGSVAAGAPFVSVCDTVSADTFWVGSAIAKAMEQHAAVLTDGKAKICTTQMEDNASLAALKRGSDAGKLNFSRVLVLRTGSDFDQEGPGQTAADALAANGSGYQPAMINAYRVANALTDEIIHHWPQWQLAN